MSIIPKQRIKIPKTKPQPDALWDDLGQVYKNHLKHIVLNVCKEADIADPKAVVKCLNENSRAIARFIEMKKTLGTKRTYYSTMTVFYKRNGNERTAKIFQKRTKELAEELQDIKEDQELAGDRLKNFVVFQDIVAKREGYKQLFKDDPKDNKVNLQYLILALYTLQPPIRSDYEDMMIKRGPKPKSDTENYLWFNSRKKRWVVLLNNDKVSKTFLHGKGELILDNKELNNIIDASLKAFPRTYILSTQRDGDKPAGYQGFRSLLNQIFEDEGKVVGVDILRSSYISDFYSRQPTVKQRKELARKMRHSWQVAEETYNKVIRKDKLEEEIEEAIEEEDEDSPKPVVKKVVKKNETNFDLKAWTREYRKSPEVQEKLRASRQKYYEKNKEKVLRSKIITNLNSGNVDKPSKESIDKYNLKFDEKTKKWS